MKTYSWYTYRVVYGKSEKTFTNPVEARRFYRTISAYTKARLYREVPALGISRIITDKEVD